MAYQNSSPIQITVGVCSEDDVNYDIRALDGDGTFYSETVARSGNTLPQVTFNNFVFGFYSASCEGRLRINGTIGAGENQVTLALNGDNIQACFSGGSYYDAGSFDVEVTVPLSLSGDCPDGLEKAAGP